jgi:hypothetical protein
MIRRALELKEALDQTWESGKPGVPKGVLDGYPETKILGVGYPASPG